MKVLYSPNFLKFKHYTWSEAVVVDFRGNKQIFGANTYSCHDASIVQHQGLAKLLANGNQIHHTRYFDAYLRALPDQ